MCRSKQEGGRRCSHETEYGRLLQNLNARRQYHARNGNTEKEQQIAQQIDSLKLRRSHMESLEGVKFYPHPIELTPATNRLLSALTEAGFTPYIVGGTVRDALTGEPIKDVDVEVYGAEPESLTAALKTLTPHVDEVGQQFGVMKVQLSGEEFDVSLPRTENRTGASHTSFEVETNKDLTLAEASARRDFTVNALMYDYQTECILDPQGGVEDWKQRTLKHVSDAFDEDPLRVLRGSQMAARFNMTVHPETLRKAETLKTEFPNIAKERVQIEFQKLFTKSFHPHRGIEVVKQSGWDTNFPGLGKVDTGILLPQLANAGLTAAKHKLDDSSRAALFGSVIASHITEDKRREFLSYITVGDRIKNIAYSLATSEAPENMSDATLRHWAKNAPTGVTFREWVRLQRIVNPQTGKWDEIESKTRQLKIWDTHEEDIIKGGTLMETMNYSRNGKWVGKALREAREAQYSNKFRNLKEGIEWLKANRDRLLPETI